MEQKVAYGNDPNSPKPFAVYDDKLVSGSGSGYNILQLSNNRFVVL